MHPLATRRQRLDAGAALRKAMPRGAHAAWAPAAARPDPLAILAAQGTSRIPDLLPTRYQRMRASPFAFFRGAAAVMAADLASQPATGLTVQLCGDAHLGNFGGFASPEGRPVFDVNDFDETLPGPFEWDVKRLAASLVVCGGDAGLGAKEAGALARRAVRHYRMHISRLARLSPFDAWHSDIDLRDAVTSVEHDALRQRLKQHLRAAIRAHGDHYGLVDLTPDGPRIRDHGTTEHIDRFRGATVSVFEAYRMAAPPELDALLRHYRLADTAFKVVGIGSVGTFCALGLFASGNGDPLLLQAREAQRSVVEMGAAASAFAHQGERVVAGQRIMQAEPDIFLAAPPGIVEKRFFYVRRLKDTRMAEVGALLEAESLPFAAALCGRTLARAHARGGDAAMLAGYIGEGDNFDDAVAAFAAAYADQNARDWRVFCDAIDAGHFPGRADAA